MKNHFKVKPPIAAVLVSLFFSVLCYSALHIFKFPPILPCSAVWANHLVIALVLSFLLQIIASKILGSHNIQLLVIHAVLIAGSLWLGLYQISPLGYSSGRIPNPDGFTITTANRSFSAVNLDVISLQQGATVGISPAMLNGEFHCDWISANGGGLESPTGCDAVYQVPDAGYDILRLRVRSACGLPDSIAQIKISILP